MDIGQWWIQGRGPGGPDPSPLMTGPPPPHTHPPTLSQGLDPSLLVLLVVKGLSQEKCPNLNESTV